MDDHELTPAIRSWCELVLDGGGLHALLASASARATTGLFGQARLRTFASGGRIMYTLTREGAPGEPFAVPHVTLVGPYDQPRAGLHAFSLPAHEAALLLGMVAGAFALNPLAALAELRPDGAAGVLYRDAAGDPLVMP